MTIEEKNRWEQCLEKLPEKLERARKINVKSISEKTGSSVKRVEEVLEYPSLLIEFGNLVLSDAKPSFKDLIEFDKKIHDARPSPESDVSVVWVWLHYYLTMPSGWGEIHPRDYLDMEPSDAARLNKLLSLSSGRGIADNAADNVNLLTIADIYKLNFFAKALEDMRSTIYSRAIADKFEKLVKQRVDNCRTKDDLIALLHEFPFDCTDNRHNGPYRINSDGRGRAMKKLDELIRDEISNIKTSHELGRYAFPVELDPYYVEGLERSRGSRMKRLLNAEEAERIRQALIT